MFAHIFPAVAPTPQPTQVEELRAGLAEVQAYLIRGELPPDEVQERTAFLLARTDTQTRGH